MQYRVVIGLVLVAVFAALLMGKGITGFGVLNTQSDEPAASFSLLLGSLLTLALLITFVIYKNFFVVLKA